MELDLKDWGLKLAEGQDLAQEHMAKICRIPKANKIEAGQASV
jgi:hypothetical protein